MGIINHTYGVNIRNPGLYILKVDVKCRQPRDLLKLFEGCPFFLNGFIVAGNRNLTMMFICEDLSTLEAIIDQHVRPNPAYMILMWGLWSDPKEIQLSP